MSSVWRFKDPPETAVYTSRQVYVDGELLGLVAHDLDGDWQFLHNEGAEPQGEGRDTADLMVVHFHHIIERFPEVEGLSDLPVGWTAWRDRPNEPWVREPIAEE